MNFAYVALNKTNQKVEGELAAADANEARKRLHDMGLSILSITEQKDVGSKTNDNVNVDQQTEPRDYKSFEFKAIDPKGKEIIGTIDADEAIRAYLRLRDEFHFTVESLFDLDASEIEKEKQKNTLTQDLEKKYELFHADEEINKGEDDDLEEFEKKNKEKLELLRGQIEVMVAQIRQLLNKTKADSSKKIEVSRIETLIGEMERIKMSNNVPHIRKLAERILDMAEELFKDSENYQVIIKQKESLKKLEKFDNIYHQDAVDIGNVSGILNKLSVLVKKYSSKLGLINESSNITKKEKLEPVLKSDDLIERVDLIEKSGPEIKESLKTELKKIVAWKVKPGQRSTAFKNAKTLLIAYLKKPKLEKDEEEKTWFEKIFSTKKDVDKTKSDYENVFREIDMFLSWLIFFYLIYLYLGGMILQKNLGLLNNFFYKTFTSEIILFFVFFVFVFSLLTKIKIKFLRQSFWGGLSLCCVGFLSVLIYVVNY